MEVVYVSLAATVGSTDSEVPACSPEVGWKEALNYAPTQSATDAAWSQLCVLPQAGLEAAWDSVDLPLPCLRWPHFSSSAGLSLNLSWPDSAPSSTPEQV